MDFFDVHTHNLLISPSAIISCNADYFRLNERIVYASVGIHPWNLTEENSEALYLNLIRLIKDKRVLAIGEAGLDKIKGPSLELQTSVFRQEILLAEECRLPMVIHCVRAFNELLYLKKKCNSRQTWIIHGFRGKEALAKDLLRHGCWLSFGEHFQDDALKAVPVDRLFIESDEADKSIKSIYERVAQVRGMSLDELNQVIKMNVQEVFFK